MTGEWQAEYERWQARDLSARRYVYVWADGVCLQARMEDQAECILVLIGATPAGKKELVGFQAGVRESAQSWRELLVEIKRRGLSIPPRIAVGDGALGFWKALDELFPGTHHQRCWLHKTANVLNKVPKSVQPGMKAALREIYLAPTRAQAEVAVDLFEQAYGARYPKAVECVRKDQRALLAFFDWPAEHWIHLRTTNPIESVFATVRHRTVRTKGSLSPTTARLMVFKLISREFAAYLGLVPRQHSTGGKPRLGSISKMGNRHLRKLPVIGAHAALYSMKSGKTRTALADWARSLLAKKPFKVVAVALANKMARIAWAVMARSTAYEPGSTGAAVSAA